VAEGNGARTVCRRSVLFRRQASRRSSRGDAPWEVLVRVWLWCLGMRRVVVLARVLEWKTYLV